MLITYIVYFNKTSVFDEFSNFEWFSFLYKMWFSHNRNNYVPTSIHKNLIESASKGYIAFQNVTLFQKTLLISLYIIGTCEKPLSFNQNTYAFLLWCFRHFTNLFYYNKLKSNIKIKIFLLSFLFSVASFNSNY